MDANLTLQANANLVRLRVRFKVHFLIWYQSYLLKFITVKFDICWVYYFTRYRTTRSNLILQI